MGNLWSQARPWKRNGWTTFGGVKNLEEHSAATPDAAPKAGFFRRKPFSPQASGLLVVTWSGDRSSLVVCRKLDDARTVALESFPAKECVLYLEDLFQPLEVVELEEIFHALYGRNSHEILVIHEPSHITITGEVLQCLRPGFWLNDEVINLYLELLKERERREPKKFLKCHFFNTFFYNKLTSGVNGYDFSAVRRWTTQKKLGYALVECDKVFVPIHKTGHWCLVVIDIKDEAFLYLDSLGGMDTSVLKFMESYLVEEASDKSGKEINTSCWKKGYVSDLPRQKNGWDCGMFMLKYMDFYSRGLELLFDQEHMDYFRKRTVKEILRLRAE